MTGVLIGREETGTDTGRNGHGTTEAGACAAGAKGYQGQSVPPAAARGKEGPPESDGPWPFRLFDLRQPVSRTARHCGCVAWGLPVP